MGCEAHNPWVGLRYVCVAVCQSRLFTELTKPATQRDRLQTNQIAHAFGRAFFVSVKLMHITSDGLNPLCARSVLLIWHSLKYMWHAQFIHTIYTYIYAIEYNKLYIMHNKICT